MQDLALQFIKTIPYTPQILDESLRRNGENEGANAYSSDDEVSHESLCTLEQEDEPADLVSTV